MENQAQQAPTVKEKIAKAKEQQKVIKQITKLENEIIALKKQISNKQNKLDELAKSL
jgi:predicted RNase H-like nuclease (RuvC/YqgF family)